MLCFHCPLPNSGLLKAHNYHFGEPAAPGASFSIQCPVVVCPKMGFGSQKTSRAGWRRPSLWQLLLAEQGRAGQGRAWSRQCGAGLTGPPSQATEGLEMNRECSAFPPWHARLLAFPPFSSSCSGCNTSSMWQRGGALVYKWQHWPASQFNMSQPVHQLCNLCSDDFIRKNGSTKSWGWEERLIVLEKKKIFVSCSAADS